MAETLKNKKYLLSVDSKEYPGKIALTFVQFTTELVDPSDPIWTGKEFTLLDRRIPEAQLLKKILGD